MSKQDMRPTPPEEHYTVDEILEEFGSGAPAEEPSPIPEPAPEPQPEPESEPKAGPEPVSEPEYRPDDTPPPPRENPLDKLRRRIQARQEDPDEPGLEPEEDDEDAVLPERTPLKQRLSAAVQWVRDRIPARDLEEPTDAPEEPPEPEPTMDDAAREQKWQCAHLWQEAWEHLRHGRVTAPAAALLCGLVALADSAWCLFLGNCPNLPFAAPAAALLYLCVCGQYRAARARYDSFRLAQLGGVPPYVASVTTAGACKQQGRLEGFYRLWQSPDPAARWQPILTPLYLALATVLALVAALAGHQMNRFLWLWSALLSATVPLSLPLSGTLPLSLLCRRLHKSGCAVAGWKGARAISAARRVVVTDEDLFPAGVLSLQKKGKEGLRPGGHGGAQRSEGIRRGDQPGSGLCRGPVPRRRQSADPSVPAADGRSGQLPL